MMKIIIDLQGLQREGNRKRGIGRYCLDLTKALINFYPENEYILFTNSALSDLRNDFFDELHNEKCNLIYFECPTIGDINEIDVERYSNLWLSTQLRSYAISIINADIILITSFFDGFRDNTLVSFDSEYKIPPVVSIIYDLIPLIHRDQYLRSDPEFKLFYFNKIKELSRLDGLLAISESSRREASENLEINPEYIFNISSACNQKKFSLSDKNSNLGRKDLGKFLLYCGATDPRKNLCRLIEAYSILPLDLIFKHKLVLTGPYTDEEICLIKEWMISFGLPPEYVVFLGYVTDIQLANLYRNCYLFIFPSLHEGFGLPVLEAMSCGAPVIASNITSIPEIVGDEDFLFDPYNPNNISSLIYKSLTNKSFYNCISCNSLERVKHFSWRNTAKNAIESLSKVIERKSNLINNNDDNIDTNNSYKILKNKLLEFPINIVKSKSNLRSLKLLTSAISIINKQSKKIQFTRKAKNTNRFIWSIEGPFDTSYSLAILNRNFALGMYELGQNVLLRSTDGPGDYEPDSDFLERNKIINDFYEQGLNNKEKFFICTRNLYPPRVNDLKGVINLLHAYGWEESMFPSAWVKNFNSYLTCITVMSSEVKKILIDNGVHIPISVCGLGIDHIDKVDVSSDFILDDNKFTFLHISSCFPRKGIDYLIESYFESFTSNDNVILIIKTFKNPHNKIEYTLKQFIKKTANPPEVLIIDKDLSPSEIKSLYLSSNALVAPSCGEGFNLTVAEAMRLGIPVITTGWGGQLDFCNNKNSFLLDFTFEYSDTHIGLFSSVWARPSSQHLSQLMKKVYHLSNDNRLSIIKAAKDSVCRFSWKYVAERNLEFLNNLSKFPTEKRSNIGWISTWKTRCGIATYSEHLLSEIKENYIIFAPNNCDNLQENVVRCWDIGNSNLDSLLNQILANNITSIVIQFNYGFFEFKSFSNFLRKIYSNNIKIIIFLHSTTDPKLDTAKRLVDIKDALSLSHRILVHTPSDLNRLKDIGLVENVALFPHGILDFDLDRREKKYKKAKKNIIHFSTYGFCLPNKGFPELIKAIEILRQQRFQCRLSLYTALYESNSSLLFYQELVDLIENLKLQDYVKINTTFMSDEQTLNKLSATDLVVFPYQLTNESASGAVRQAISSFTPVAVTPLSIFDDVLPVVHRLPGKTPLLIAKGLKNWSINYLGKPITNAEREWRKQHSFEKLGYRIQNLIKSLEVNYYSGKSDI